MSTRNQSADELPQIAFGNQDVGLIPTQEDEFEPDDVAIANLLDEYDDSSGVMVRIYRQGAAYRDQTFIDECPPSEFSPKMLHEKFGGGKFRIHARSKNGIVLNRSIQVAPPQGQRPPVESLIAPVQGQINALADAVKQLISVVATRPAGDGGGNRRELIQEMMLMKDLFSGGQRAASSADPFDTISKALALSKELGGAGGGGESPDALSVIMRAMEVFGKPLAEAAAAQQRAMPIAVQHNPAMPLAAPQEQTINQVPQEPAPQQSELDMLRFYLKMLIGKAAGNSDPNTYAELVVDNLDDATINELLSPPNWWENLCAIEAGLSPYREWFADLRRITLEILTEEQSGDIPDANQSGGTNDATAAGTNANIKRNT